MMDLEQNESKYLNVCTLPLHSWVGPCGVGRMQEVMCSCFLTTPESVVTSEHSDLAVYPDHDEVRATDESTFGFTNVNAILSRCALAYPVCLTVIIVIQLTTAQVTCSSLKPRWCVMPLLNYEVTT